MGILSEIFFCGSFSGGVVKSAFYVSIKTFSEKNPKIKTFFIFSESRAKPFLSEFFRRDCETWILRVRWENVIKMKFFWKLFWNIFRHGATACRFSVDTFSTVLSILQYSCPKKNIFRTKVCEKLIFSLIGLRHWLSFLDFCLFLFNGVVKIVSYLCVGVFWGKKIRKKKIFSSFSVNERKKAAFGQTLFSGIFKIAFIVSTRTFWGKRFWGKLKSSFHRFVQWAKSVWPSGKVFLTKLCLNWFLHVPEIYFRKKVFHRIRSIFNFFVKVSPAGLWNLDSTGPLENLMELMLFFETSFHHL